MSHRQQQANWKQRIACCCALLLVLISLQGCLSTVMTAAEMVYEKNEINQTLNNHRITIKANAILKRYGYLFKHTRIIVTTFNNELLLVGQVKTQEQKNITAKLLRHIKGLLRIYNQLTVGKNISLWRQSRDTWLTTKIKSKYIANNIIHPSQIKVVTENGVVFLMGHIKQKEAKIAVNLAKHTRGVNKVVTLFRYLAYVN